MIARLLARRRYMREHRWTHAHLSEYLDGELGAGERDRIEAHTNICPQCTRVLATLRRTLERLALLGTEQRSAIADGVVERLRHEPG